MAFTWIELYLIVCEKFYICTTNDRRYNFRILMHSLSEDLATKTLQVQAMGGARVTPGSPVLRPGTSSGEGRLGVPTGGAHKMRTSL